MRVKEQARSEDKEVPSLSCKKSEKWNDQLELTPLVHQYWYSRKEWQCLMEWIRMRAWLPSLKQLIGQQ